MGIVIIAMLIGAVVLGVIVWRMATGAAEPALDASAPRPTGDGSVAGIIAVSPAVADERVSALAADAPDAQRAALADGEVTLPEYEAAVRSTVSCFESGFAEIVDSPSGPRALLTMDPIVVSPDSFEVTYSYGVTTTATPTQPEHAAVAALEERCHRDMQQNVKDVYQTRLLADPAYVSRVATEFTACARDAGVSSLGASAEELVAALQQIDPDTQSALRTCFDRTPSVGVGIGTKVAPR